MAPRLTRKYLQDHISGNPEPSEEKREVESAEAFADALLDGILVTAQQEFSTDSEEQDEIQLSVPVTLRPVDGGMQPETNCVEVCVGLPFAHVCYHRTFRGRVPGPDP